MKYLRVVQQLLELDLLVLHPSCLLQRGRVVRGGLWHQGYLGFHLCQGDLLDPAVRQHQVDLQVRVVLNFQTESLDVLDY